MQRVVTAAALVCAGVVLSADQGLVFDFETGLDGWEVLEGGFDRFRCSRAEYHHHGGAYKKHGTWFLSTLERSDGRPDDHAVGVAESPVFRLTSGTMSFMVGGGSHPNTYVALCDLQGKELRRAQGRRSQEMVDVRWDLPELVGKAVYLRIADGHRGGWGHVTFDCFQAQGSIDADLTVRHRAERADILPHLLQLAAAARAPARTLPPAGTIQSLREAITFLSSAYGAAYASGPEFLAKLDVLASLLASTDGPEKERARERLEALRRRALLANPLVRDAPMVFVVRHQYKPDHHNTATMFQAGSVNAASYQGGGALKTIDFRADPEGKVTTLLDAGADGVIRDPDVHFSGDRIVFSMRRNRQDDYHICEIRSDGTQLRQLTAADGVSDIDPLYLPDDSIVFTSTREPKFCMCNRHIMGNLFRMTGNGGNIHQIGKSTLHEGHGNLTPDGRILYDRWEYVDRNFGDAQGLWTVNPDGTNHALFWGNNTASPGGVLDGRVIPGSQRAVCVFGSCHDRPWGALAVIDRRLAVDGRGGVVRTWPRSAIDLVDKGNYDTFKKVWPRYEDPFPLVPRGTGNTQRPDLEPLFILCSRMTGQGEQMGLFLLDTFGNEIALHSEPAGCYDPMPLARRMRPGIIPSRRNVASETGVLYVSDVYVGTHMRGVERGDVRFLRVVESPEKRYWTGPAWGGQGVHRPAMNWHSFENKRILGTVPVHPDGSASVAIPAERFVYFQLLDSNGMMVQSMRSGTMVQPGEVSGCVGCHEPRQSAPALKKTEKPGDGTVPVAVTRPPSALDGWHGPPRRFSFIDEVQPVFDAHCVSCHDVGKPAGKRLNLAGDRTETFNVAYNELWRRGLINAIGAGPAAIQPARAWGSHSSRLVQVIRKGHHKVALSAEDMARIVTWIDLNAPYYPTYATSFPDHLTGRCPLTPKAIAALSRLTGVPFDKQASHQANKGPRIFFDRPELSPCLADLAKTRPDAYQEALDIIRLGAERLKQHPRGDSLREGVDMCDADRERLSFYRERRAAEENVRQALRRGETVYDPRPQTP